MKRIICLLLSLLLLVFGVSCKAGDKKTIHGVDIASSADMGALSDGEFKIGDAVPEEKENDDSLFFTKDGARSYFSNGDFCYYYNEKEKEPKVYGIAAFSKCMGFDVGSISVEVTEVLDGQDIKYTTRAPSKDEVFFLPQSENREIIACEGLKYSLVFVFEDNALCAAYLGK